MKVIVWFGTILLLQQALILPFSEADTDIEELRDYARIRRGWNMMRLGRGLQMLRLGKRTAPPPLSDNPLSTPEKMRELLDSLLEENREDFIRRQAPAPWFGRELDENALEELNNLVSEAYLSELLPYPVVYAGRFKRSTRVDFKIGQDPWSYSDESKDDLPKVSPQIGQYLRQVFRLVNPASIPRTGHQNVGDERVTRSDVTRVEGMMSQETPLNDQHQQNMDVAESEAL